MYSRFKIRPYFSIVGLYLIRGWALLVRRQIERTTGIRLTARVATTSLFSAAILPMAYTAAYQPVPVSAPAPIIAAKTVTTWKNDPPAPVIGSQPAAPVAPTAVVHAPGTRLNGYVYGQCTYYVASKRAVPGNWGNARTWLPRAAAAGYKTGTIPAVGAIAWTPFGRFGHVAYVTGVSGDTVTVSEMNYVGWNKISTRTVSASSFKYIY